MGDIILTAPVIRALRQTYPALTIDYLAHEQYQPLIEGFDPPPDRVIPFPSTVGAAALPHYARTLAKNDYDLVIDLHDSLRSKLVRRYFHGAQRFVYRKPRFKRWLLFNLLINRYPSDFSVVNEYLRYAGLDPQAHDHRPALSYNQSAARELLTQHGLKPGYLACVPGAAWSQKSWLKERYIALFQQCLDRSPHPVVLLGGPDDRICDEIAQAFSPQQIVNLKGRTSLEDALGLLAQSRGVVGSDTGLVHASEALGVPVVMILGPTSRETGAATHHPAARVHEVSLWCRPCSQNGKRPCYRREQFCLTAITVSQVTASVHHMMGWA